MNDVLSSVLVLLGIVVTILLSGYTYGKILKRRNQGRPLATRILRSPGQSHLATIDGLSEAMHLCMVALFTAAVLFPAGHLLHTYSGDVPESWTRIVISAGGGFLFAAFFLWRWYRLSTRRRRCRLVLEGELIVGRALDLLAEKGYQIFHDFPAERFHINHIVIGPTGVMVVETKTTSRGTARRRRDNAIVTYDGRMLHFPKNSDYQTIDQAKVRTAWFSRWLSQAVEEPISARAIVAVPGWRVKRTSADGIPVVNPQQFATLFEHIRPRPLAEAMTRRIVRCMAQGYRPGPAHSGRTQE